MADAIPTATDTPSPLICARALSRHYGTVRAVDEVELTIGRGELFGLIGHNGAGKTTLFKMMLGLVAPTGGMVTIDGIDVAGAGFRQVRRRVGYLPENVVFYDNLTGLETLLFFAKLKAVSHSECGPLLAKVGLAGAARRPLKEYSKGMRQRLGLAQALLGNPALLFLDEPTTGLDPEGIRDFYAALRELQVAGVTVVLTSHILAEIQQRVDRLAIMAAGRVRAIGSVQALRAARPLPVTFEIRCAPGRSDAVRAALGALPLSTAEGHDHTLRFESPPDAKMQVLEALARLGGSIRDISVREATLEDVFFGLTE